MQRLISSIRAPFYAKTTKPSTATVPVQILSDLHLEVGQQYADFDFPPTAPYLILAGDIGLLKDYAAYLDFLRHQVTRYDRVFLVLGNHEFYGLDFDTAISTAKRLETESCLEGKLCFLHRARVDLPHNITVLGCTLWTNVPQDAKDIVSYRVSDFGQIKNWTVDRHNEAHGSDLTWLKKQLEKLEPGRSVIVITHHAPSVKETSRPEHLENPWSSAFTSNVIDRSRTWSPVTHWVYGHTHYSAEFEKHGVHVVSNQRGYVVPGAQALNPRDEKFDPGKRIHVPVGSPDDTA